MYVPCRICTVEVLTMNLPVPVEPGDRRPVPGTLRPMTPWPVFPDFERLWERMNRLFFDRWPDAFGSDLWTPAVDIEETEDAYLFEVELPGINRDDIHIDASGNELAISGQITERERVGVLRHRTRRTGAFLYRASLPSGVDTDGIKAEFSNGVLAVRVPRTEAAKPRRIPIV
jgi:HSP20 family protein